MKKHILSLLVAVGLIGSASAQILFSDDFSDPSSSQSKWNYEYQFPNVPGYKNSTISVVDNTMVITDGGTPVTKASFNQPFELTGSFMFTGGNGFFITLRSDGIINPALYSHPSGINIQIGPDDITAADLPDTGSSYTFHGHSYLIPRLNENGTGLYNTFKVYDDGTNVSIWINGVNRLFFQDTFSTGSHIAFDPGYSLDIQDDVQVKMGAVTVAAVPEPSTYALFGIGAIGLLMVLRRKTAV